MAVREAEKLDEIEFLGRNGGTRGGKLDEIEFLVRKFTSLPLSTIHVPKLEMGMAAAKTLLDCLNQLLTIPVRILVPCELKLRQSSGD